MHFLELRDNMKSGRSSDQGTKQMADKPNPWSPDRTMRIIIQDDTYRDVINWKALPKSFLPSTIDVAKEDRESESKPFLPMVEPEDIVAAVKAYIQEEKGIPFKKQKLLNEDEGVLRDAQTLISSGIKKGSTLILRYAPITPISVFSYSGRKFKLMVQSSDTIADVKAGIRSHKQYILYNGRQFKDDKRLIDCGIQYNSELDPLLRVCGC
ncbi:polyubiquitin 8-like isoform X2 [Lycium ferocissimum]|uniref:polyubiquitin 8-like isoform X2 n=1 Tax=Lycium ferocissimum TaxID=112874 RepID=UPI00281669B4|nr:polyubiquitin 8-like isoform X2 [Lycium ferocissimum]